MSFARRDTLCPRIFAAMTRMHCLKPDFGRLFKDLPGVAVCLISLCLAFCPQAGAATAEGPAAHQARILILNSYHPGYIWSDGEAAGLLEALSAAGRQNTISLEYMDTKHHTGNAYLKTFKNLMQEKYAKARVEMVLALDNPALEFIIRHRHDLFQDAPVVFCGINDYRPDMLRGQKNITGIAQNIDPAGTLEVMLKLHPKAKEIYVINDFTVTGLSFRHEMEELAPNVADRVKIRFNENVSFDDLLADVQALGDDSLVLLESFVTDFTGRVYDWREVTEKIVTRARVPVYGVHEERLGLGIVGGKLLDGHRHGADAAAIALRILAGEKPSSIAVVTQSDARYRFDYRALERFGLSLSALPPGSSIVHQPVSFFATHRKVIVASVQIITVLCLVIAFLAFNLIQRRRAAAALAKSEKQFRLLADNAPDAIFIQVDETFAYVNAAACHLLGATSAQDILGRPVYDFFAPEDHDRIKERIRQLTLLRQSVPIVERQFLRLDKTRVDAEVAAVPFEYQGQAGSLVFVRDISEHKASQEALRASEERFRSIVENTEAGYFYVDLQGTILDANAAWAKLYGYELREEVIGRNYLSLQNEDDGEKARVIIQGVLRQQRRYLSGVFSRTIKNGAIGYHTYSARAVQKEGKIVGVEGFIIDTTALRHAEDALRASEQKFRSLFENMTEGVVLCALIYGTDERPVDFRLLEVNPAHERQTALAADQMRQHKGSEVYQDDAPIYLEMLSQVAKSRQAGYFETRRSQSAHYFGISVFSPSPGQYAMIFQDIAQRKQMQEAIEAEKERLMVTLQSIADGVMTTDIDGRIVLMNRVAEALTGWQQPEAYHLPLTDIFCSVEESSRKPAENPVLQVLASGSVFAPANHRILISRDKTEKIITENAAPIRDSEGSLCGVVLVFRDTTSKKRMEDAVRNAEKLEAIGLLAGGIAHDFNNLLGGIFGYLEMIKRDAARGDLSKVAECVTKALGTYERAIHITRQLLTFSKGGAPLRKKQRLDSLVRESVTFVLTGSNITAEFSIPEGPWLCNCDETQIAQVIDNIVINARESMPAGGVLQVCLTRVSPGETPKMLQPAYYFKLTLRDSGSGIAQEHLPHIFDPFFTTRPGGSGLGLATSYSIIKKHHGYIEAQSRLGAGSAFHIYLPQYEAEEAAGLVKLPSNHFPAREDTVLVMDDEDVILDVVTAMLKARGLSALSVREGDEAIARVREAFLEKRYFTAAILDLTIPGGRGGREIVREMAQIDPGLMLIAASGYSDDPVMASPETFGFHASLFKPFRLSELDVVLRKFRT